MQYRRAFKENMFDYKTKKLSVKKITEDNSVVTKDSIRSINEVNSYAIISQDIKKFGSPTIVVYVEHTLLTMEIDTGSAISCISQDCY